MKKIPVRPDQFAIIDDSDYAFLSQHKWSLRGVKKRYAYTSISGKSYYMHRLIMDTPKGYETDHVNGDPLDNRRINLRICTPRQNQANSVLRKTNKTGYKGVVYRAKLKKWEAKIRLEDGRRKWLGYFNTKEEAGRAYIIRAKELYEDFARVN